MKISVQGFKVQRDGRNVVLMTEGCSPDSSVRMRFHLEVQRADALQLAKDLFQIYDNPLDPPTSNVVLWAGDKEVEEAIKR